MYSGSAQGVVERVINVRYYYYYHYLAFPLPSINGSGNKHQGFWIPDRVGSLRTYIHPTSAENWRQSTLGRQAPTCGGKLARKPINHCNRIVIAVIPFLGVIMHCDCYWVVAASGGCCCCCCCCLYPPTPHPHTPITIIVMAGGGRDFQRVYAFD